MSTLSHAIALAAAAHAGQVDKGGQPYILHALRVMLSLRSEDERIVGVLHDVVEDTELTCADLLECGFSQTVVDAVQALTHLPGETRLAAAARAADNPLALAVKLADNADNMNLSRIPRLTPKDYARQREYADVRLLLLTRAGSARPD